MNLLLRKIYEDEHKNNPHVSMILAFDLWKDKYQKFVYFESKLDTMAKRNKFGKDYDRLDKISQKLAKELGY